MSDPEGGASADARLQALGNKYSILGDEVSNVSDRVAGMEGQLGKILGLLEGLGTRESGGAEGAAGRGENLPSGGGGISPPASQLGGGDTRPGAGPEVHPTTAGAALGTGPSGDVSGFYPPGMLPATSGGSMYTHDMRPRGMNVDIPKLDNKTECFHWRQRFISAAKTLRIDGQFIGDSERLVPVGDAHRSRADFLREGYHEAEIERGLLSMNMLMTALVRSSDLAIRDRNLTAKEALEEICRMHEPETQGTKLELLDRLLRFTVPRDAEPTPALLKLETLAERLRDRGIPLDPAFILVLFVRCLPREYAHAKETLMGQASMDREDVLRRANTQFAAANNKGLHLPVGEQAFFAGAVGAGEQQSKRKKGKNGSGGGGGGGGNGGGGGDGGNKVNGGGGGKNGGPNRRCFRCGHPGHWARHAPHPKQSSSSSATSAERAVTKGSSARRRARRRPAWRLCNRLT